jgi:hypothetical protein
MNREQQLLADTPTLLAGECGGRCKGDGRAWIIHDDVYVLAPQDVVSSPKRRTAAIGHFTEHKAGTMQDPANGFRIITLPRTSVNKGQQKDRKV